MPHDAKPLNGLGQGVFELKDDYDTDTYRLVYAVQIGKALYATLDAYQKQSKLGIATSKNDIELLAKRI